MEKHLTVEPADVFEKGRHDKAPAAIERDGFDQAELAAIGGIAVVILAAGQRDLLFALDCGLHFPEAVRPEGDQAVGAFVARNAQRSTAFGVAGTVVGGDRVAQIGWHGKTALVVDRRNRGSGKEPWDCH